MNVKKPTTLRVVLVAIVFLLIGVGGITFVKWQKSQPSVKNFDREIRAMIALSGSDSKDAYGEETESNCIYWPNPPAPFGQSRGRLEMATHTDIAINGPQSEGTLAYVKKVEALTRLGLLEKSQVTSFISGEKKEVNRYRLSPMGWRAYSFSRNGACFKYGKSEYLAVTDFGLYEMPGHSPLGALFRVSTKFGIIRELPTWALDPELQSLFPEVKIKVDGEKRDMYLRKEGLNFGFPLQEESLKRKRDKTSLMSERTSTQDTKQAPPSAIYDEVKQALIKMHASYDIKSPPPAQCLYLPGASDNFPVDFDRSPKGEYEVIVFNNKPRTEMDKVGRSTAPYLERLANIGVLNKRDETGVLGAGNDAGKIFDASIFTIANKYLNGVHPKIKGCFVLGPATMEFIDIQVRKSSEGSNEDYMFRYKIRMLFKQVPAWSQEPLLVAGGWSELHLAQDRGQVCKGEFHFDKAKQDINGGAASCWWAFDDNYDSR